MDDIMKIDTNLRMCSAQILSWFAAPFWWRSVWRRASYSENFSTQKRICTTGLLARRRKRDLRKEEQWMEQAKPLI